MKFKVAIIDNDKKDILMVEDILSKFKVKVESFKSSIEFGHCKDPDKFDFVFIDYMINGGAGATAILKALTVNTSARIVFISRSDDHRSPEKNYIDNPVIWGLLMKDDPEKISEWMDNRIYESKHPECCY